MCVYVCGWVEIKLVGLPRERNLPQQRQILLSLLHPKAKTEREDESFNFTPMIAMPSSEC